ncbi:hypothetical protein TRVL_02530 [Trypanosoma vivax]|nr:hypothetical protein TRVL_02530 [Trypanosoma vivax]
MMTPTIEQISLKGTCEVFRTSSYFVFYLVPFTYFLFSFGARVLWFGLFLFCDDTVVMVKTNAKKHQARAERLRGLPKSERLVKSALIKKKEGRVLDSAEKHALKMSSEYGEIMRLWEVLRVSTGPANSETGEVKRIQLRRTWCNSSVIATHTSTRQWTAC